MGRNSRISNGSFFGLLRDAKMEEKVLPTDIIEKMTNSFFFLQKKTICTRFTCLNVTRKTFFDNPFAFGEAEIFILDLEDYRSGVHPDL